MGQSLEDYTAKGISERSFPPRNRVAMYGELRHARTMPLHRDLWHNIGVRSLNQPPKPSFISNCPLTHILRDNYNIKLLDPFAQKVM